MTDGAKKGVPKAAYAMFAVAGVLGFVLIASFAGFSFGGGNGGVGDTICDLTGSIRGTANDFVVGKNVVDVVISLDKTNCHTKGPLEFNQINDADPTLPQANALQGRVTIYVKVYDAANDLVGSKEFEKTTTLFSSTSFSEPLLFKNLVKGQTYTVQAFDSWEGSKVIGSKTITI